MNGTGSFRQLVRNLRLNAELIELMLKRNEERCQKQTDSASTHVVEKSN